MCQSPGAVIHHIGPQGNSDPGHLLLSLSVLLSLLAHLRDASLLFLRSLGRGTSEAPTILPLLTCSVSILEILYFAGNGAGWWVNVQDYTLRPGHADSVLSSIPLIQNNFTQFPLLTRQTWTWRSLSGNTNVLKVNVSADPAFSSVDPRASVCQ